MNTEIWMKRDKIVFETNKHVLSDLIYFLFIYLGSLKFH